jgi:hypothetical protein
VHRHLDWAKVAFLATAYAVIAIGLGCAPVDKLTDLDDRYFDDPFLVPPSQPKRMASSVTFWVLVLGMAGLAALSIANYYRS